MRRIVWITEHRHPRKTCHHVLEQLQSLTCELIACGHRESGKVSSGVRNTGRKTVSDWVYRERENNWNLCSCLLASLRRSGPIHYDDIYVRAHELHRELVQAIVCAGRIALFDHNVPAFDVARCAQAASERIKVLIIRPCLPAKAHAYDCR